jgi:hypothetical protein
VYTYSSNGTADSKGRVKAYGRVALDRACDAIIRAPNGAQESTLHRECYGIGSLIAGSALTYREAVSRLCEATRHMPTYSEPWSGLDRKVINSIGRGMERPRTPPQGRGGASRPMQRTAPQEVPQGSTTTAAALRLWWEAVDPRSALAEAYLRSRGLIIGDYLAGDVLRWHPRTGAMLALFRNILTGEPQAISRIFLDREGRKIKRRFLGPVALAAVMLDPFEEVLSGLHVSEGVETGMAARQLGLRPTWALGDACSIERLPLLGGVECLTILAERCAENARAVEVCGTRWHAAEREVLVIHSIRGKDLNDALIELAT